MAEVVKRKGMVQGIFLHAVHVWWKVLRVVL